MKRKFEQLRENLDEFVAQTEYPMLVVGCLSDELAYVVTFLQSLGERHRNAYFVVFPHPFTSPGAWVNGIVENLRAQIDGAEPLRAERGDPPFPPLPTACADRRRPAEERLRGLLQYLRGLLPNDRDYSVVAGLLPLQCKDYEGYCSLIASIMPASDVPPWMQPLRIVAYDDRSRRRLFDGMAAGKVEKVLTFEVDFSTPALTDALSRDAADPSLPVPERMACMLQLAVLDYSYQRYPDALEKYALLFEYYEGEKLPAMQALCLLGAGDTVRASGRPEAAKEIMQRGIALAIEHNALAPLLNLLISITEVCSDLNQHAEAESYADSGTQVAAGVLNPFAYADMYEKKGDAQIAQRKTLEGLAAYKRCAELCKMYEYCHRWRSVLSKQARVYGESRMTREQREAEQQLVHVQELERRSAQAELQ